MYDSVLLSAGGIRGYAHIGVLSVLRDTITSVSDFAGISAGAITASLLAVGYSINELSKLMLKYELFDVFFKNYNIYEAWKRRSLLPMNAFRELLNDLYEKKTNEANTQLKHVPTFRCGVVKITPGRPIYTELSAKRHGHVKLCDAVMASSAIPFVFPAQRIDGHTYIDGAVIRLLPTMKIDAKKTLIVSISTICERIETASSLTYALNLHALSSQVKSDYELATIDDEKNTHISIKFSQTEMTSILPREAFERGVIACALSRSKNL